MNRRAIAVLLVLLLAGGCGQKGPLYRPGQPQHPAPSAGAMSPQPSNAYPAPWKI